MLLKGNELRIPVLCRASVALVLAWWSCSSLPAQTPFVRGEVNGDGVLDVSDPVFLLFHLFIEGPPPECMSSADANDDDTLNATDPVALLGYLFTSGAAPASPFPDCGVDPTPDDLGCASYSSCLEDRDPAITEWTVPWGSSRPRDPYVDGDGRVWFVGQVADYAAFLLPDSGEFRRFNLPAGAGPHNLIVGDHVWYAGNGAAHIGKLEKTTGDVTVLPMPNAAADDPHTLVFDQNGDIWFTVQVGNFVGRLTLATEAIRLIPVPTDGARPYGIVVDRDNRPWFVEFGTNKLALIHREDLRIEEFTLPRAATRPRRIGTTSDGAIWYVDYDQGYLGRFLPDTRAIKEWRMPGGAGARPYGMAVDHRDRIWFVETGRVPNRFVGFNPRTELFFSTVNIPGGGGVVRHMYFHAPARAIWFGTDRNTIGRALVE
jgi:virginiamycin B lyase